MAEEAAAAPPEKPSEAAATKAPAPGRGFRRPLRGGLMAACCGALATAVLAVGIVVLVLWLVFRPHKPRFYVQSAAVYQLNVSGDGSVTSNMQFTVISGNPNKRVGIYYDGLWAFVSYRGVRITAVTPMPPFYQGHRTVVMMSPLLAGYMVPAPPDLGIALSADQGFGVVNVRLHMRAHIRWRVGALKTGHYHLDIKCDVIMGLRQTLGGQVPLLGGQRCSVDI